MKRIQITFTDLDIWLKILVVFGWISLIYTIGMFLLGFLIGLLGI